MEQPIIDPTKFTIPSKESINKADDLMRKDLNDLMYEDKQQQTYHAKVCCLCDTLIKYEEERALDISDLRRKSVSDRFNKSLVNDKLRHIYTDEEAYEVPRELIKHYTIKCFDVNRKEFRHLKDLYLSPNSYEATTKDGKRVWVVVKNALITLRKACFNDQILLSTIVLPMAC